MNLTPKDYTKQEKLIAEELVELGFRFAEQYSFFPYTVDFYVPEFGVKETLWQGLNKLEKSKV